jgi:hypothetical protein
MHAALLFAGLIFNLGLLERLSAFHYLSGGLSSLSVRVGAYGAFMAFGIFYVPARMGVAPGDLANRWIGRPAGWIVSCVLLPIWLCSWFTDGVHMACVAAAVAFEAEYWSNSNWRYLPIFACVSFILILPAARAPAARFARDSILDDEGLVGGGHRVTALGARVSP